MPKLITADWIHDGVTGFKKQHLLEIDDSGTIVRFESAHPEALKTCIYYPGLLTPGFINAHCHLELSHLAGRFATGTRLIPFLRNVVSQREISEQEIHQAMLTADQTMQDEGIVAVGDISNKTDTISIKRSSPIHYHSFIEAFDFLQDSLAENFYKQYKTVYDDFGDLPKSMVPHAPYSVSPTLFEQLNSVNSQKTILSIHNQESPDDDLLFEQGGGGYPNFWKSFGFSLDHFKSMHKDSIDYIMEHLDPTHRLLMIHNTCTKSKHLQKVMQWNPAVVWVTCPNANLFIENRLPDYRAFIDEQAVLAIGTDSLSSNWRLSILSEIQTILKYNAWLNLETVLKWATYHGALALQVDQTMGSFEVGKRPGVNWIQAVDDHAASPILRSDAMVRKLH